jgi:flagellar export protein FliJ
MHSFSFRLERVLRWRAYQYEAEELTLNRITARRDALQAEAREASSRLREAGSGVISGSVVEAADLAALSTFLAHTRARISQIHSLSAACQAELEKQRAKVLALKSKKTLLERLKERRKADWEIEIRRAQERQSSEIALIRLVRESVADQAHTFGVGRACPSS